MFSYCNLLLFFFDARIIWFGAILNSKIAQTVPKLTHRIRSQYSSHVITQELLTLVTIKQHHQSGSDQSDIDQKCHKHQHCPIINNDHYNYIHNIITMTIIHNSIQNKSFTALISVIDYKDSPFHGYPNLITLSPTRWRSFALSRKF